MRKKILLSIIILIPFLVLFNSCGKKGNKQIDPEFGRYIAAFTYGKISSSSEIQIELTQDIPSVELDKEIEQELFDFSPSIKGKAYWTSTRTIKFVPDLGELKQGQEYDAWFSWIKYCKLIANSKSFTFSFMFLSRITILACPLILQ